MEVPVILKNGVVAVLEFQGRCTINKTEVAALVKKFETENPEIVQQCHTEDHGYLDRVMQKNDLNLTAPQFKLITDKIAEHEIEFFNNALEYYG